MADLKKKLTQRHRSSRSLRVTARRAAQNFNAVVNVLIGQLPRSIRWGCLILPYAPTPPITVFQMSRRMTSKTRLFQLQFPTEGRIRISVKPRGLASRSTIVQNA
ncbi:hypothetical protein KIN20_016291 [Parelaphostrongylus tenuis]|uniref:Uncharacterized protein n=1 Tax=Parelaphostrongylus tenuis TaxID=148309 RepID=A0AAD5MH77_PARTN|nr:hypothetical protein KIN20_016291 [Parelaphostrongylus tenuis]